MARVKQTQHTHKTVVTTTRGEPLTAQQLYNERKSGIVEGDEEDKKKYNNFPCEAMAILMREDGKQEADAAIFFPQSPHPNRLCLWDDIPAGAFYMLFTLLGLGSATAQNDANDTDGKSFAEFAEGAFRQVNFFHEGDDDFAPHEDGKHAFFACHHCIHDLCQHQGTKNPAAWSKGITNTIYTSPRFNIKEYSLAAKNHLSPFWSARDDVTKHILTKHLALTEENADSYLAKNTFHILKSLRENPQSEEEDAQSEEEDAQSVEQESGDQQEQSVEQESDDGEEQSVEQESDDEEEQSEEESEEQQAQEQESDEEDAQSEQESEEQSEQQQESEDEAEAEAQQEQQEQSEQQESEEDTQTLEPTQLIEPQESQEKVESESEENQEDVATIQPEAVQSAEHDEEKAKKDSEAVAFFKARLEKITQDSQSTNSDPLGLKYALDGSLLGTNDEGSVVFTMGEREGFNSPIAKKRGREGEIGETDGKKRKLPSWMIKSTCGKK